MDGPGQIRTLVVSKDKQIAYDIWRATARGNLEHLHYLLISSSDLPIDSSDYEVKQGDVDCGHAALHMYRRNDQILTHPSILLLSYGPNTQPFGNFKNRKGSVVGQTQLDRAQQQGGIQQFWLDGYLDGYNVVATTGSGPDSFIALYPYAEGSLRSHHHAWS